MGRRVVHVVATDRFAGVESYVANVAVALRDLGWSVVVVGGDPTAMGAVLRGSIDHRQASNLLDVARQLRSMRPALVHAHMTDAEAGALISRPWHGAPIVVTRHFAAPRGSTVLARLAGKAAQQFFACEIAISDFVRTTIDTPTTVIPNGVPDEETGPHDQRVVLVAQRLEREKKTALALDAWSRSAARHSGWRLQIAGEGSEEFVLRRHAKQLGIEDTVDFLGFRLDLRELRAQAGIFLATAPKEPLGLAVLEAMANGLPVIAANGGGHLETVGGATPELLFGPEDPDSCARLIDAMVGDANPRLELGERLQARQRSHYNLVDHASRLGDCYSEILGSRSH